MQVKYITTYFLFFFPLILAAQIDTSITLRSVLITSTRTEIFSSGIKQEKTDSILKLTRNDQTLGDYLNEHTPMLVKNYGPGALSSVSFRGGSAYHTTVLWKGFPLANPMNGVMDFNLLPTFLFDDISIQYGGSSSLWGSGAISGVIHLADKTNFTIKNVLKVGSRYSSASGWMNYIDGKFTIKNFCSSSKVFLFDEKNKFPFHQNGILKRQVHAEAKNYGIISENTYLINSTTSINFNFWVQFANRNIAPVLSESVSDAVQHDKNHRYTITFTKAGTKGRFIFRNAYFNESLYYNDSSLANPSNSLCKTFISEPEYSYKLNENNSFQVGGNFTKINAVTAEFIKEQEVIRKSIFLLHRLKWKKINTTASVRQEFNRYERPPIVYSIGIDYALLKSVKLASSYSSVYRNPQINDLFWQPGGNIHLLPETGKSYEATIEVDFLKLANANSNDSNALSFRTTFYNKDINNWIAWTPHGFLWSPANIKNVHSYGTENSINIKKQLGKIKFWINAFYGYTISETTSSIIAFDASVNKQLIYVPLHKAGGNISVGFNEFLLSFNHTYTGIRFTSTDNLDYLKAFEKSNIQIDKKLKLKNNSLTLYLRIDNLFNSEYQAVLNHPESLRNFSIGIRIISGAY